MTVSEKTVLNLSFGKDGFVEIILPKMYSSGLRSAAVPLIYSVPIATNLRPELHIVLFSL
jgi:hypothetical protein